MYATDRINKPPTLGATHVHSRLRLGLCHPDGPVHSRLRLELCHPWWVLDCRYCTPVTIIVLYPLVLTRTFGSWVLSSPIDLPFKSAWRWTERIAVPAFMFSI
jgi:hypothetical protein